MSTQGGCGCGTCASCAAGSGTNSERPGQRGVVPASRRHGAIKRRLLDGIARAPELDPLSVDADTDPTIALVDAWATALHVLSFYVERFHGESYLDTATELVSVDGLARMVGYRPTPALSASTWLSFTVDAAPGSPALVRVPAGMKVQTVPRPGELPAVFETGTALEARPEWNELAAQRWQAQALAASGTSLYVAQTQVNARPGDAIALIGADLTRFAHALIDQLEPRLRPTYERDSQRIALDGAWVVQGAFPGGTPLVAVFGRRASPFGYNAPPFKLLSKDILQRVYKKALTDAENINPPAELEEWPGLRVYSHSQTEFTLPQGGANPQPPQPAATNRLDLDAVYPEAFRGRHVLLSNGTTRGLYRITAAEEVSRTAFGVNARVTRLTLDRSLGDFGTAADARSTSVLIETERLTLAEIAVTAPVNPVVAPPAARADRLVLAAPTSLPVGRHVILKGRGVDGNSAPIDTLVRELARVLRLEDGGRTVIFDAPLANAYDPQSLVLLGNVVAATHGETRMLPAPGLDGSVLPEILGSGDARRRYQAFALRQPGLTFLPAANALGYAPALEVRVDGELRPPLESLYGRDATDPGYVVEAVVDAPTRLRFAARLPSGLDNVTAVYRVGGGPGGNLDPDRLITPLTMPGGLRTVTNALPAAGGDAAEGIESARRNAPSRVVTFERVVSLGDYEAFARAYAGVTQALASLIWSGQRQIVCLTIAGPNGAVVPPESALHRDLTAAISAASAPGRRFRLFGYVPRPFGAQVNIAVDPRRRLDDVKRDVAAALAAGFAAAVRTFGAPVARSQVLACVQSVDGVRGGVIDAFVEPNLPPNADDVLGAAAATETSGAEMLVLEPSLVSIGEMPA